MTLTAPLHISEVKNEWSCTSTAPIRLRGVDKDNFYVSATIMSRSRTVGVVTRLRTGTTNKFFKSRQGREIFRSLIAAQSALGPKKPRIQQAPGGVKLSSPRLPVSRVTISRDKPPHST